MRRISYSGGSFLTTDAVSEALLQLVAALGMSHRSEAVSIPVVQANGKDGVVQLVIGPASELVSSEEETTVGEPDTTEAVAELRAKTESLAVPKPVASEPGESAIVDYEYDQDA